MEGGFAGAVEALAGQKPDRLGVAVSGGPDSLALLWLAHRAFPGRTHAFTVDHCFRPEAADEAAHVAQICASISVPCERLRIEWRDGPPAVNRQAAAREARYRVLAEAAAAAGLRWLATAHHRDDQAETVLMRLARGAGLDGLRGIRPRRPLGAGVQLLRPLLDVPRGALAEITARTGWAPVQDPANADPAHDRTRIRQLLQRSDLLSAAPIASAARNLARVAEALDWTAEAAWHGRHRREGETLLLDIAGLPQEIARRLTLRALRCAAPGADPRGPDLERFMAALAAGRSTTLAGVRASGGTYWSFAPERESDKATRT